MSSKKFQAKYPYLGYTAYQVFSKKEGRFFICLVPKVGSSKKRTTVSRARYRMAVSLGRKLKRSEQVDHIDNDKTNDRLGNLQILTVLENNRKAIRANGKSCNYLIVICPICRAFFKVKESMIRFRVRHKLSPACCSRSCGGVMGHMKKAKT